MSATRFKRTAIDRLLGLLSQPQHPYQPSTEVFLDLNVDRVADELRLVARGNDRGAENQPPSDSQTFDDVEHTIIERIEAHKQHAHSIFLEHLHTYDQRLTALNFEERFATIQQAAPEAVGEFRAEAALGRDELFGLRRRLYECELERDHFRESHQLARPARLSTQAKTILKIGILAVLFVIEVVVNATFLSPAHPDGWLGAAGQAFAFAFLNIIASFLFGIAPIRLLNRREYLLKLVGFLGLGLYLTFAIGLNLTLAHLREIPPSVTGNLGQQVMARILSAPHVLSDVNSWVFFGIGFTFSLIAMADGIMFTDPYFGYAALERRCIDAREHYTEGKAILIDRLRAIRTKATEVMNAAARDLSVRRGEFDSIMQARSRLAQRFGEHQSHIERTCRAILSIYREANRKTRTTPAPAYFPTSYVLERIKYTSDEPSQGAREQLQQSIIETQSLLKHQIEAIHAAFDEAARSYRELDDLIPEEKSGASSSREA